MKGENRIALNAFPEDWRYYTLSFPVARYQRLSLDAAIREMVTCNRNFYSMSGVLRRVWASLWPRRKPLINLIANLSARNNSRAESQAFEDFQQQCRGYFVDTRSDA
jgi:hypothetical protein